MKVRMEQINSEIQKALSEIIQHKVKNPNLASPLVSVLSVDTTSDLKHCKVVLSIFDQDKQRASNSYKAICDSKSFIKYELGKMIIIRQIPDLNFVLSDEIEYGFKIDKIINDLKK